MSIDHALPRSLSAEQRAFVAALRDFARRECGTREQRDALTAETGGPHAPSLYARLASAIRSSSPSSGRPTDPSRKADGLLVVNTPTVSVSPRRP